MQTSDFTPLSRPRGWVGGTGALPVPLGAGVALADDRQRAFENLGGRRERAAPMPGKARPPRHRPHPGYDELEAPCLRALPDRREARHP